MLTYLSHIWVVMYKQQVVLLTEVQHLLPELDIHNSPSRIVWVVQQQASAAVH